MKTITLNLKLSTPLGSASLGGTIEVCTGPPMPGPLTLVQTRQEKEMLIFKLSLPVPGAYDVASRELTTQIGADPEVLVKLAASVVEVPDLRGKEDSVLKVSLVDVDGKGNRSPARQQEFTLTDTIAPPEPGEMGVTVTGQEPDPPTPTPLPLRK